MHYFRFDFMAAVTQHIKQSRGPGGKKVEARNQLGDGSWQERPVPSKKLAKDYSCRNVRCGIKGRGSTGREQRESENLDGVRRYCNEPCHPAIPSGNYFWYVEFHHGVSFSAYTVSIL